MPETIVRRRDVLDQQSPTQHDSNGQSLLSFCSNDYLGLSTHPDVLAASSQALHTYGMGSRSSALLSGYSSLHEQLEAELARFFGFERAILFSTGYMANLGLLSTLLGPQQKVLMERRVHASIIDGVRLSGARFQRFRHQPPVCDADLIITEGVFSMDGDFAPLRDFPTDQRLLIDDAHAIGWAGSRGAGSLDLHQIAITPKHLMVGTLSKAFGCLGGFVAGCADVIEQLVQQSRPYIYTTALPVPIVAGALASLQIIENQPEHRQQLHRLIESFRAQASARHLPINASQSPIQILTIGSADQTVTIKEHLKKQGILVQAIRPPTVPDGRSRLRISLCAQHREQDIDQLCEALQDALT